jgi:hypothetical protein
MVHIQSYHNPRRSLCDPQGPERDDLRPPNEDVGGNVEWCPECLRVRVGYGRDFARTIQKQASPHP